jgi:Skp family chaperone for outer membrane proteins
MKKIFLLTALLFTFSISWSQKSQTIAYIDMEYILENIPEYLEAQNTLDKKIAKWRQKLDKQARYIEVLKTDLANEKAILTKDLIVEKEEEISIKHDELRRLESLYFGPKGDMFALRKQLVKPIQDQVYNAIQNISARKKYDFVFDKSSELVMLYSNKKYDISDLVLGTIDKTRLIVDRDAKRKEKNAPKELTSRQKEALTQREVQVDKKATAQEKKKKANIERREAQLKKREEKKEQYRKKREAMKKKREDAKKDQTKQ